MNLEDITHEQFHAMLALITLNVVLLSILLSRLETVFTFFCWCDAF